MLRFPSRKCLGLLALAYHLSEYIKAAAVLLLTVCALSVAPVARAQAPTILSVSSSQTVNEGSSVTLAVSANGATPFTYQWRKDGSNVAGATTASLTLNPVRVADAGTYTVVVTNTSGSATGGPILLGVNAGSAPVITGQSTGTTTITAGGTLNVSAQINGTTPVTYVWKQDGVAVSTVVSQSTSTSYTKSNLTAADAGTYTLTATNILGSATTTGLQVVVAQPTAPSISPQPNSTLVETNSSFSFSIGVNGTGPFTYQWFKNGVAIVGATSQSYSKSGAVAADAGSYTVTVSSSYGSATSAAATLTVRAPLAPIISSISSDTSLAVGSSFSLSVSLSVGTTPLSYQWSKDGAPIAGAAGTSSSYSVSSATPADAGSYSVTVSNSVGSVTSSQVRVSVLLGMAPIITVQPPGRSLATGSFASFSLSVSGTSPFTYQWKRGGTVVGTDSSYSISSASASDAGDYTVTITNAYGTVTSETFTITILPAAAITVPIIVAQPSGGTLRQGDNLGVSVLATSTGSLTYQWYKDGTIIGGATGSSYSKSAAASSDAGSYTVTVTSTSGSVTSDPAVITVGAGVAPEITSHPASYSISPGGSQTVSVSLRSTTGVTYQWYKDGVAVAGATSSSYSVGGQPALAGSYTCVITNGVGSTTSRAGVVTVDLVRPTITSISGGVAIPIGSFTSLSVSSSSSSATYQWLRNGVAINGATSSSYSLSNFTVGDATNYSVAVTANGSTVTSGPVPIEALDVGVVPVIIAQPASQTRDSGSTVTFSVSATGETPLAYQWFKDGIQVGGATSSQYSFTVSSAAVATYTVKVTNRNGNVTSAGATLRLTLAAAIPAPVITVQPASVAVALLNFASFSVNVQNSSGVTYQWRKDGTAISGATSSSYGINSAAASSAGLYSVVVTNSTGTVTSTSASLTILATNTLPSITTQPLPQSAFTGGTASFSVVASGATSYQWRKNGVDIAGATSATYSLSSIKVSDAGAYSVVASNSAGLTASSAATLAVTATSLPVFSTVPQSQNTVVGSSVVLSAAVTGVPSPTVQWTKNGTAIAGATSTTLSLANVQASDAGSYVLVATNLAGTTSSAAAALQVFAQTPAAPSITTQPVAIDASPGGTVTFSVGVTGFPVPAYQWRRNGVAVAGATSATLTLSSLQRTDAGDYSLVATNDLGSVTSSAATLRVFFPITITGAPLSQSLLQGSSFALSVAVQSGSTVTYQWRKNGVAIAGATSATYSVASAGSNDSGRYTVLVTNSDLSVESAAADVAVTASSYAGVYSGTFASGDAWSLQVAANGTAIFIAGLGSRGQAIVARDLVIDATGAVRFGTEFKAAADVSTGTRYYSGPVNLSLNGTSVSGSIPSLSLNFAANKVSAGGASTAAGYYRAVAVGTTASDLNLIASPDGVLTFVAIDPDAVRSGRGQVAADGSFAVVSAQFTYSGALTPATSAVSATYQPTGGTAVTLMSAATPLTRSRLGNLSTRATCGPGDRSLITGFYIDGTGSRDVLLRTAGPALLNYGVANALPNPRLRLMKGSQALLENDDWSLSGVAQQVADTGARLGAFPFAAGSADSAIVSTLAPGGYSAISTTSDTRTGIALFEIYDAATGTASRFVNCSIRGEVSSGDSVLILGFAIVGDAPLKVLLRGVGPTLASYGVTGVLTDPELQLYRGGTLLRRNNAWSSGTDAGMVADAAAASGAFALPSGSKDASILLYLAPGVYSAQLRGSATGVGLIEIYDVP